jgi:hypothetical protein
MPGVPDQDVKPQTALMTLTNMASRERKFVFDKVAILIRYIGTAGAAAGTSLPATIAGAEAYLKTNPNSAVTVSYQQEFNVPEPTGNMNDATDDEFNDAGAVRAMHQARWGVIIYWDDDNDEDSCPASRACSSIDWAGFPGWLGFNDTESSLRLKLRPGNTEFVVAHELGHIFGAPDEYAGGGGGDSCDGSYGIWRERNGNSHACSAAACLMKASAGYSNGLFPFDNFTRLHWGWNDNDGDLALQAIDQGNSAAGTFMRIENVQPGDVVKIYKVSTGELVRDLP